MIIKLKNFDFYIKCNIYECLFIIFFCINIKKLITKIKY